VARSREREKERERERERERQKESERERGAENHLIRGQTRGLKRRRRKVDPTRSRWKTYLRVHKEPPSCISLG
jgi:hypothetical protein